MKGNLSCICGFTPCLESFHAASQTGLFMKTTHRGTIIFSCQTNARRRHIFLPATGIFSPETPCAFWTSSFNLTTDFV